MKVLTANRLVDGEVVFWRGGHWVERFADAEVFADDDPAADGADAVGKAQGTTVVDVYLIDIADGPAGVAPVSFRERIRALGPTNLPEHGKQAEGGAAVEALVAATGAARSTGRVSLIRRK